MSARGIRLRHLAFHGPNRTGAIVTFGAGLNVVYGASDTGKSFIVEAIDFMLGGRPPLREFPERLGYDRVLLGFETLQGETHTIQRAAEGGAFRVYAGLHQELPPEGTDARDLADQHSERSTDNLSTFLLECCGLENRRVRKNNRGATNSLSFRNLARLVIVDENEIIEPRSPLSDGNFAADTPNFATFRLLLTGNDDSAIVPSPARTPEHQSREAQIELVDQMLADYRQRLDDLTNHPDELQDQLAQLEMTLEQHTSQLATTEASYRELVLQRRRLRARLEEGNERASEIDSLVERFALLDRHYVSDLARLRGIEEGGTLFETLSPQECPLCGAPAEQQHRDADCDANVPVVVAAARAEAAKIELLRRELAETVAALRTERAAFERKLPRIEGQLRQLSSQVETLISPQLTHLRSGYKEVSDKRGEVREALGLLGTVRDLERRRAELEAGRGSEAEAMVADADLPAAVAEGFAQQVETILGAWHFPDEGRVTFDSKKRDLVIAGKHRGARGKGLRAITHAAFTIGILDYCRANGTAHPGFIVLDSPLLAYREPEGNDDDLTGTDLKDRFYDYLATWSADRQVLIIENTDPPDSIRARSQTTFFSKNPHEGRYGFFPLPAEDADGSQEPEAAV